MSAVAVRAALESYLATLSSGVATAWENASFTPPASTLPYQQVFVLFANPDNSEWGSGYRENGYMQVTLKYPLQKGSADAMTRAMQLRSAFFRGLSLTNSGVIVNINGTPSIGNGSVDGDRWSVPVKIPFHANVF